LPWYEDCTWWLVADTGYNRETQPRVATGAAYGLVVRKV
jgi:hypothetical protein